VPEAGICSGMTNNSSRAAGKPLLGAALVRCDQTTLPMPNKTTGRFELQAE